jgi:hypothetical protein
MCHFMSIRRKQQHGAKVWSKSMEQNQKHASHGAKVHCLPAPYRQLQWRTETSANVYGGMTSAPLSAVLRHFPPATMAGPRCFRQRQWRVQHSASPGGGFFFPPMPVAERATCCLKALPPGQKWQYFSAGVIFNNKIGQRCIFVKKSNDTAISSDLVEKTSLPISSYLYSLSIYVWHMQSIL